MSQELLNRVALLNALDFPNLCNALGIAPFHFVGVVGAAKLAQFSRECEARGHSDEYVNGAIDWVLQGSGNPENYPGPQSKGSSPLPSIPQVSPQSFTGATLEYLGALDGTNERALQETIRANQLQLSKNDLKELAEQVQLGNITHPDDRLARFASNSIVRRRAQEIEASGQNWRTVVQLHATPPPGCVCRVKVYEDEADPVRIGTGIRVTDTLVLTCFHVTGTSPRHIELEFPKFTGIPPIAEYSECEVTTTQTYQAATIGQEDDKKVLIVSSSPPLDESKEIAYWDGQADIEVGSHLDYALIELDLSAKTWSFKVDASDSKLPSLHLYFLTFIASNNDYVIRAPRSRFNPAAFSKPPISIVKVEDWISEEQASDFEVKEDGNRIRYRTEDGTDKGNSGSPIIDPKDGILLAIHHASSLSGKSQAVPIQPILSHIQKTIREVQMFETHYQQIVSRSWFPPRD